MVVDTNIIIACLKGEEGPVIGLSDAIRNGRALFVSSITVAETLALPTLTPSDIEKARGFLKHFISVPFDDTIAMLSAMLRRTYSIELPDAGIAATAIVRRVPLVTRDRQFRKIKEITVVEL